MNIFVTSVAICALLGTKASASYWNSGHQLQGIPDERQFSNSHYPQYDILPLGEYHKGHLEADQIKVHKYEKLVVPQPFPVKVPIPHPYPVHVPKPYPVEHTKYVKVPFPVTQVVEKKVPYPVEVPKPYPVPVVQHEQHHGFENHHGDLGGYESAPPITNGLDGGDLHQAGESGYGEEAQHYGGSDVSSYQAKALESDYSPLENGWKPLDGGEGAEDAHY